MQSPGSGFVQSTLVSRERAKIRFRVEVCVQRMRKFLGKFLLVVVAVAIAAGGYLYYRESVINRLYAEAAGYPQVFRGTEESRAAVKELAAYRGQRSKRMLLSIALGKVPFPWPAVQAEAIKALRDRNDPEVSRALAKLLQPHEGLGTREAVALALRDLPCDDESIRSILHYLERVWRGEKNAEELVVDSILTNERAKEYTKKKREAFYDNLYAVLRRENAKTIVNLVQIYGIGSDGPSLFALDLLSRLGLHEVCPLLLQSEKAINQLGPELYNGPRQELQATIASLNCK